MNLNDATGAVADKLRQSEIPFMLVGGYSSNFYGIPRSTNDCDFVVQVEAAEYASIPAVLGSEFEPTAQLAFETNTGTLKQEFRVTGTRFAVEFFKLSEDPHDQERFRRRIQVEYLGRIVSMPTAEDVIIWKLRWGRSKDKDDVRNVMSVQRGKLDWNYIEHWCAQHKTLGTLNEIRKTVPDI